MSRENVERIRRAYVASDPLAALAEHSAPDVEFDLTAVYPDQPVFRGIDEARRYRDASPWGTSQRFAPERFFDVDDERVLVFVQGTAMGGESGVPVEAQPAHEFTIRDGLLVRFKVYLDRAEALKAAGLSERTVSCENVEVARRLIELNRSDDLEAGIEAVLSLADPNCEWTSLLAALEPGRYRGHHGLRSYFNDLADSWEEWRNEVEELVQVGEDTVVATVRFQGVGRSSGVAVETRFGLVLVLSDRKLLRGRAYPSREEALEAAGLHS